mmetsp:Transcript_928/g.3069  ORF Transcript_928/g.3069 Transcript_928/m.3069 type:complete len:286 (+) Transcript_928:486-1343(+)|eukprot:31176-Pelagococcus_subviridis.AAC.52
MDVIDGHALVLNALHRDRHERAVAVGTEQHLLLVRDATAQDDAADDSADALHRERIVQVHHPVTFLADVEDASCRDVVQEQPDEVHALASDARRVEHRRDRSLRDRLAAAQDVLLVLNHDRHLVHPRALQHLHHRFERRVAVLLGREVDLREDDEERDFQSEHDGEVFLCHPDDATAVAVDDEHRKVGKRRGHPVHRRLQIFLVPAQVAEVNHLARLRHDLRPSKAVRLSHVRGRVIRYRTVRCEPEDLLAHRGGPPALDLVLELEHGASREAAAVVQSSFGQDA